MGLLVGKSYSHSVLQVVKNFVVLIHSAECLPGYKRGGINDLDNLCVPCEVGSYMDHLNRGIECDPCPESYSTKGIGTVNITGCGEYIHTVVPASFESSQNTVFGSIVSRLAYHVADHVITLYGLPY